MDVNPFIVFISECWYLLKEFIILLDFCKLLPLFVEYLELELSGFEDWWILEFV